MSDRTTALPPGASSPGLVRAFIAKPEFGPLVLLVLMLVTFTAINPTFLSLTNIGNALTFTVELGLIALAMTLLMTSGEFDLSVGSVFGFAPVVMWTLFNTGTMPLPLAFLAALAVAMVIGLANGLFVTRLNIPSFLVTLGMLLVVRGTALWLTDGFPQRTWDAGDQWLASVLVGDFYIGGLRVYMSLIWFILLAVVFHYALTKTRFGNWIQATGGNPGAARNRGVNISRVKVILFMVSAAMAAFAGIISSIRVSAANPNSGTGYELEVIAMVVIGGTALTGGRGTVVGTLVGILLLGVIGNGLVLENISSFYQPVVTGAILLVAIVLDEIRRRVTPER